MQLRDGEMGQKRGRGKINWWELKVNGQELFGREGRGRDVLAMGREESENGSNENVKEERGGRTERSRRTWGGRR